MTKAYAQPLKKQAWRLFQNNTTQFDIYSEVIPIWNVDTENLSASDAVTSTAANQDFTLIIVDKDVASLDGFEGNYYLYTGASDDPGVLPGVTPVYYAQFMDNNPIATWSTMGAVPEPTSGLLILLGMAGLALRRRRA